MRISDWSSDVCSSDLGVTAYIAARVNQHRSVAGSDFCKRHGLTRLVLVETYDTIEEAIAREKAIKAWKRRWKLNLIGRSNPDWIDLFPTTIGRASCRERVCQYV